MTSSFYYKTISDPEGRDLSVCLYWFSYIEFVEGMIWLQTEGLLMAFLRTTRFSQQEEISCDGNSDRSAGMMSREIIEVLNGGFSLL